MQYLFSFLAIWLTRQAFAERLQSQACSTFALDAASSLGVANTVLESSILVPIGNLNVKNVTNTFAFCQVTGMVNYGTNETLHFQIWLPDVSAYTGRFMAVGGGGMAGVIDTSNMMSQLNQGFAVAGGDSGHLASTNNNGSGAPGVYLPYLHNTDEVEAWIHNAISLFTAPAKNLVALFYGEAAKYSYYDGCSTGGAQGFALAQFHPYLFDGIIAGSPGNWYSHLALSFLWNALKTQNESYLSQTILDLITSAVLDACDGLDGVKDGLIENPLTCQFDIATLACESSATNTSTCLTPAQLTAAQAIYRGPTDSRSGIELYPGFSLGSESEWLLQEQVLADAFSIPILQNLVFDNLNYDYRSFNFGSDVDVLDEKAGFYIDEISTNLTAFKDGGGKILVTQGWTDPLNAAIWPIQHLESVQDFFGHDVSHFFNLFMIPGGGHCGAAAGYPDVPAVYHTVEKLVQWVETGEKPKFVISTDPPSGANSSRLLCPWPETAVYKGGDNTLWSSYVCEG